MFSRTTPKRACYIRHSAFSPGRRTAKARQPRVPACVAMTSAADMHADSDTVDASEPDTAAAAVVWNSNGMS